MREISRLESAGPSFHVSFFLFFSQESEAAKTLPSRLGHCVTSPPSRCPGPAEGGTGQTLLLYGTC